MIRETTDGDCVELDFAQLNEQNQERPNLSWSLRGSDLNQTFLQSASLVDAQLEGAQLEHLYLFDGEIDASIDDFTRFPELCTQENDQLHCTN